MMDLLVKFPVESAKYVIKQLSSYLCHFIWLISPLSNTRRGLNRAFKVTVEPAETLKLEEGLEAQLRGRGSGAEGRAKVEKGVRLYVVLEVGLGGRTQT